MCLIEEVSTDQPPWYHGVKWRLETRKTEGHPSDTVVVAEKSGHGYVARMWNGRTNRDQWAELIAAAPETATERDSLKQEIERLRSGLEKALIWMEMAEVTVEGEWGSGRSLEELEQDGDLSEEIILVRAALRTGG